MGVISNKHINIEKKKIRRTYIRLLNVVLSERVYQEDLIARVLYPDIMYEIYENKDNYININSDEIKLNHSNYQLGLRILNCTEEIIDSIVVRV